MKNLNWILCPVCGSKTRDRIREDTILRNYPLYCPKCKQESLIDAKDLQVTVIMKKEINKEDVARFNKVSKQFAALFVASLIAFIPLAVFLKIYGVVIWAILYLVVLGLAFKVERLKKSNNIHTYKEIVAFSEGKRLDEIQEQREIGKRPYQTALKVLAGAAVGIVIAAIAVIVIELLK